MTQIIAVIGLVGMAMLLLSVGVIFRKDHKFHAEDVGESKAMRQRGIYCAKTQDRLARRGTNRS